MAKRNDTTKSNGSDAFGKAIKAMLDKRASDDPLFMKAYTNKDKSIAECCNYIINEVKRMKVNALTDEEVLGLAVHYYDEADIKADSAPACTVVVPGTPELTDARKAELQREAEQRFIDEAVANMRAPKTKRATTTRNDAPTLF